MATPGLRLAATLIDLAVGLGAIGLLLAAVFTYMRLIKRHKPREVSRPHRVTTESTGARADVREAAFDKDRIDRMTKKWARGMWVVALVSGARARNARSAGFRVLGLRRVEVPTGGAVGVRAAVIRHLAVAARRTLLNRLLAPIERRATRDTKALHAAARELVQTHAPDQPAFDEALAALYREHNINPLHWLARPLLSAALTLASDAPTLLSPLHQSLPDRLAGTVVVRER